MNPNENSDSGIKKPVGCLLILFLAGLIALAIPNGRFSSDFTDFVVVLIIIVVVWLVAKLIYLIIKAFFSYSRNRKQKKHEF